ncbi:MAG: hypothetical protein AAFX93_13775 [Verrucomicrobiota bacterium]
MITFYRYFLGNWTITDLESGDSGTLVITEGSCGTCHVVEYKLGEVTRTELWGYDPTNQTWRADGFSNDGERFTQTMLDVPEKDQPEAGDHWKDEHKGMLPTGESTYAMLDLEVESRDAYLVTVTQAHVGETKLGTSKMRCARVGS